MSGAGRPGDSRSPARLTDRAEAGASTVVLMMTDVEGSTRMWADHPVEMNQAMVRHHDLVHGAVGRHRGWRPVDQGEGDAVFAAFDSAADALAAVVDFQRGLAAEQWPAGVEIRVRVGVHAGVVVARGGNLFGSTVNRCARLRGLGAGGQVLLSASVHELVRDSLPDGVAVTDLGEHRMKDLTRPEHVYQLVAAGLANRFPELASLDRAAHNLPVQTSSFLGRRREIGELVDLIGRERLVTIAGFGGTGKTRLALQVAAEMADGNGDGVWFIDLSASTVSGRMASEVARVLGVGELVGDKVDGPLPALIAWVKRKRTLLVLDNLEHLLPEAAEVVEQLLGAAPGLRVLTTSRESLNLRGEQVYSLTPLPVPPPPPAGSRWTDADLSALADYDAAALFLNRASRSAATSG